MCHFALKVMNKADEANGEAFGWIEKLLAVNVSILCNSKMIRVIDCPELAPKNR